MASFVVARGQIEKGKDVVARKGDGYKPKNAAERDRLVAAGVLVETDGKGAKAAPSNTAKDSDTSQNNGAGAEGSQFGAGDGAAGGAGTSGA
ncbi:hypothetical protein [Chromohalobacter israelensis]|uniref:hypothetical protein n=1 Tax=Chromohalobacter israelensis TaxID=141390 RepID=UPI000FFE49F9|nr:hypothetical protein [Chromohalobacter salexigens]RXE48707.1 hypothetical protein B4O83_12305 [Chromohalobacter salexigens]